MTRTPNTRTNHTRRLLTTAATVGALGISALSAAPPANADVAAAVGADEWPLTSLHFAQAWSEAPTKGAGVTVAVIDSGVSPTQPDLFGSLVPGMNFTADPPSTDTDDVANYAGVSKADLYHGTGVASTIAGHAHADPSASGGKGGMIGLAPDAKIMPLVNGDMGGHTTTLATIAAINYAVAHHVGVINMSFGGEDNDAQFEAAIRNALNHDIVLVASAGNSGNTGNPKEYPAAFPGVVAVAATDKNGSPANFSQYGSYMTLAAPGVNVARADGPTGEDYVYSDGTSFAAPLVSAEAALLRSEHPTWTAGQVIRVMISTADSSTPGTRDPHLGYGIIDPVKALTAPEPSATSNPLLAGAPSVTPGVGVPVPPPVSTSTPPFKLSPGEIALACVGTPMAPAIVLIVVLRRRRRKSINLEDSVISNPGWRPGFGIPPQQQYGAPQPYGNQPPQQQFGPPQNYGNPPPQNWNQPPNGSSGQPPTGWPPQQPGPPPNYPPNL